MPIHSKSIGILGGGQLARMLAMKATQMGLQVVILSEKSDDPAAGVAYSWMQGSLKSADDIQRLMSAVDIVTFESEFISADLLKSCLRLMSRKKMAPNLNILSNMQDRLLQKENQ